MQGSIHMGECKRPSLQLTSEPPSRLDGSDPVSRTARLQQPPPPPNPIPESPHANGRSTQSLPASL